MTSRANQLTDRIRNELLDIDRAIELAEAAWRQVYAGISDQDIVEIESIFQA